MIDIRPITDPGDNCRNISPTIPINISETLEYSIVLQQHKEIHTYIEYILKWKLYLLFQENGKLY